MARKEKKLKVLTVLGTRPEIIRLSRILPVLDAYTDHVTVYTNQNYDPSLSAVFFKELGIRRPNYSLKSETGSLGGQIGSILSATYEIIEKEEPDAFFVLGDTNSCLSAIIAKRRHVMVFHMEAGNRSFDENVPEETNRRIIDHISDINIAYTDHSRRYLIREGIHPGTIYVVGSPLREVFSFYKENIESSNILTTLSLSPKKYLLVSAHREENVDKKENLSELMASLNHLTGIYNMPAIVSLHPRTKRRISEFDIKLSKSLRFMKPFGYFDYMKLQKNAFCTLSDSGTIQEESAILGFPAVQIRVSSERPEAFDAGSIVLSGFSREGVVSAVGVVADEVQKGISAPVHEHYSDAHVSSKVVKLILGLANIHKHHDFRIRPI